MKVKWCCSPARQASASRGLRRRYWSALLAEPHTRLRYFCSPQHTDSALYPIISQMERAARFTHADTAQVKLDKLDALLAQSSTSANDAALFAEMLSLPNDGRYPTLELTPQQRRQKTLEALHRSGRVFCTQKSGADDLRGRALGRPNEPGIVWSGSGPDRVRSRAADRDFPTRIRPALDRTPHVTSLAINRLTRREVEAMIDRVVGQQTPPGEHPAGHHRAD